MYELLFVDWHHEYFQLVVVNATETDSEVRPFMVFVFGWYRFQSNRSARLRLGDSGSIPLSFWAKWDLSRMPGLVPKLERVKAGILHLDAHLRRFTGASGNIGTGVPLHKQSHTIARDG